MMTDSDKGGFPYRIFNSFQTTPEGLALYRIFVSLFILFFLLPPFSMYEFLGSLPSDFFHPPPGPMWLFSGFPPEELFYLLHSALLLSLAGMLVGYKTRMSSIAAGLILLVIKGFFYSVGKINHEMLLMVVPILMSFSGWGAAWSLDARFKENERPESPGWPLALLALIIGFMMFTAGFPKLIGGWLYTDTQATMGHYFNQFFVKGRSDLLAELFLEIENRMFWELLDYLTVFFEIGFLLAVLNTTTFRIFVSFAVLFHFSTLMMLNISFLPNLTAYAAFIRWDLVHAEIKRWVPLPMSSPFMLGGGMLFLWLAVLLGSRFAFPEFESDLRVADLYILLLALPVALVFPGKKLLSFFQRIRSGSGRFEIEEQEF